MEIKPRNETEKQLIEYIDRNCADMYALLSELVKIDTVNYKKYGNENNGQDYLEKLSRYMGLTVDRFVPDSVPGVRESKDYNPGREADKRDNLVAILPGKDTTKSVMLASHMDTELLGDAAKWTDDPLSGTIRDGKLYGRGSADDKSGLAVSWFLARAFQDLGIVPSKNLILASYSDEEGGGGNGALALGLKYPCDFCISLDSSGFETEALGGGCFRAVIKSTKHDKSVASVFDVFEGVSLAVKELEKMNSIPKTNIRLSSVKVGEGGVKEGLISLAIYTDMTKEACQEAFDNIFARLEEKYRELELVTEGFRLVTRFFIYGETPEDSCETALLRDIMKEQTGEEPDTTGHCLSDLSLLMAYGCKNSFNYGVPRGSAEGGGAHQPNEHVVLEELNKLAKNIGLVLLRM